MLLNCSTEQAPEKRPISKRRFALTGAGVLAVGQCCTALLALLALWGPPRLREFFLARYCYYFLLLNWASAVALWRFLRGQKQVLWQPRTG